MDRRFIIWIVFYICLTIVTGCSDAAKNDGNFPNRQLKIVVARAAGGSADIVARAFAPYFQQTLGVQVVVENIEGGAGKVGLSQVFHANPDGYTLVLGNFPSHVLSQEIEGGVFHNMSEFEPIAGISGNESNVLAVSEDSPFNSLQDLLNFDKANRGQLHMAVTSGLSNSSLAQSMLVSQAGLSAAAVPFDSGSDCIAAVIEKRVDLAVCSGTAAYLPLEEENIKVLCSFGPDEDLKLPGVPTFSAAYGEEYGYDVIMGLLAPPGTPDKVLALLREAGFTAAQNSEFAAAAGKSFNVAARDHNALAEAISGCYELTETNRENLTE